MGVFVILGIIGIIVVVAMINHQAEKQSTEGIGRLARNRGFTFLPQPDAGFLARLKTLYLFSRGRSKRVKNMMVRTDPEVKITVMDYRFTTGSGKNSHTWNQTVALLESEALIIPNFELRPENLFNKIGSAFGFQDIDFSRHPEFSNRYLLRGKQEAAVRRHFTPEVLRFLETRTGLSVEGERGRLVVYRSGRKIPLPEVESFLREALRVFELLKAPTPTVVKEQAPAAAPARKEKPSLRRSVERARANADDA